MVAGLEETVVAALGEQTADIVHTLNRWFEQVQGKIDALAGAVTAQASTPARPATAPDSTPPGAPTTPSGAMPSFTPPAPSGAPAPLRCETVASFDVANDWSGWRHHQAVHMRPGGILEIRQDRSTPGVVSSPVDLPQGGLLRVSVEADFTFQRGLPRPHIRVLDEADGRLGPDTEISQGTSDHFFFVSHRTTKIRVSLIVVDPKSGYGLTLTRLTVETVEPDSYFARQRETALAPSIASMASIPARRAMMRDCVDSLLVQCDRVRVFLNGYPDVPEFLNHPRIDVRRSQDWDDKGDAGKFGWIEAPDEPGYRVIVDDDLIFPPDFTETLSGAVNAQGNRAIVAMHGVLLKQPVTSYYDPDSRSVFYFQSMLRQDRTCHVLGTNALCYYSESVKMSWSDYMFRNMADIFLARYAQQHRIPMITPARPQYWVRQNDQEGGFETIYENSLKRTRSKFDSSQIQDALVKWIAPLTLQPTSRAKIVFGLVATSVTDFEAALDSWEKTRWADYDWVVIVTCGTDDPSLRSRVAAAKTAHELHIVDEAGSMGAERVANLIALARRLGFHALCLCPDTVRFKAGSWTRTALGLCTGNSPGALFVVPSQMTSGCETGRDLGADRRLPVLALSDADSVDRVGAADVGLADGLAVLGDWISRLARANGGVAPIRAKDGGQIAEAVAAADPGRLHEAVRSALESERTRRPELSGKPGRPIHATPPLTVNEVFERVLVINLDRRPDRWRQVGADLATAGIAARRVRAIDGTWPEVAAEYRAYLEGPLAAAPAVRAIRSKKQFYQDYDSEAARVAFIETREGRKAIQSAGAWGYLKTWEQILEEVLRDRVRTTLVLDDDVVFHRNATAIFAAAVGGLPPDWLILQLGTLQYEWREDWMTWRTPFLYQTNGSAVGSHAVGFHFDIVPLLLEHVKRMLLPFDTGALSMATRAFKDRCFVICPNVAIQSLQDESDIGTSDFQKGSGRERAAATYRWNLPDYPSDGVTR